jgi:hypothetical protein
MDENLRIKIRGLIDRTQRVLARANPGPWQASDSGFVSDADGFVVCHLTARRGAQRWDWERNPNTPLIAEARVLLPEMSDVLVELTRLLDEFEAAENPSAASDLFDCQRATP